jgi:hypothetical protein
MQQETRNCNGNRQTMHRVVRSGRKKFVSVPKMLISQAHSGADRNLVKRWLTLLFLICMVLYLAKLCASVLNIAKSVVKWIFYRCFVEKMSRWRSERHLVAF